MSALLSPWVAPGLAVLGALALVFAILLAWPRLRRPLMTGALLVVALLLVSVSIPLGAARDAAVTLFPNPSSDAVPDRLNVALLGADSHAGETEHIDAISVLSVSRSGGPNVLFTLPRGTEQVPLPSDSPLRARWTSGVFDCGGACPLSTLYPRGEIVDAALYDGLVPAGSSPGLESLRDGLRGATGLDIHGVVKADAAGLGRLVDALGGVTLTVDEPLPVGGDPTGSVVDGWIEAGTRTLTGAEVEWFVRSRSTTSDGDRIRRQTEVVTALAEQTSPLTLFFAAPKLADALAPSLSTDLSVAEAVALARSGAPTVIPLLDDSERTAPDWPAIHARVAAAVADPHPAGP